MERRILVAEQPAGEGKGRKPVVAWAPETALVAIGWIGVVLVAAALADYALAIFPTAFSSMEWEFGTISQVFAGLPLLAIGLAAIWVSGAGTGRRWLLLAIGVAFVLAAVIVLVLLIAFALDIPVAIRASEGAARQPVVKLALKTVFMGLLFGASFVVTGVLALRQARGTSSGERAS